jgi:hypothetical protein
VNDAHVARPFDDKSATRAVAGVGQEYGLLKAFKVRHKFEIDILERARHTRLRRLRLLGGWQLNDYGFAGLAATTGRGQSKYRNQSQRKK